VLDVDIPRKRISLTLRLQDEAGAERPQRTGQDRPRSQRPQRSQPKRPEADGAMAEALRRAGLR
jgi:uncharacterized protein